MWLGRPQNQPVSGAISDVVRRWPAAAVGVLTGDSRVFPLSHSWMVSNYLDMKRVRIIDCAVRFDSHAIVDELLRLDQDVDTALMAMDVRRAFTPYQILEAIHNIPTQGNKAHDIYYFLAPFKQFFDGDVASDEAAYLLHLMNERIRSLGHAGWSIIVVEKAQYDHAAFSAANIQLRAIAQPLWEIVNLTRPEGIVSVLRTSVLGESNGKNHRTLQYPASNDRSAIRQVPSSPAEARSGATG